MRRLPALVVALALLAPVALAYPDPQKVPRYYDSSCFESYDRRFVHDYLGLFPTELASEMEGAACEVYAATSAHFVIVTTATTEGETLENFAYHLFEAWGIGNAKRLDGFLLLFVDDAERSGTSAIRMEVGYGLEGVVNSLVTDDAWDIMIDARDRALAAGESPEEARAWAMGAGAAFLLTTIRDGYTEAGFPPPAPRDDSPPLWFWIVAIVVILVIIVLLSRGANHPRRGWGYYPSSPAWSSRASNVWIGHGGGSFGGGGGFGGGRSGGGGRGGRF